MHSSHHMPPQNRLSYVKLRSVPTTVDPVVGSAPSRKSTPQESHVAARHAAEHARKENDYDGGDPYSGNAPAQCEAAVARTVASATTAPASSSTPKTAMPPASAVITRLNKPTPSLTLSKQKNTPFMPKERRFQSGGKMSNGSLQPRQIANAIAYPLVFMNNEQPLNSKSSTSIPTSGPSRIATGGTATPKIIASPTSAPSPTPITPSTLIPQVKPTPTKYSDPTTPFIVPQVKRSVSEASSEQDVVCVSTTPPTSKIHPKPALRSKPPLGGAHSRRYSAINSVQSSHALPSIPRRNGAATSSTTSPAPKLQPTSMSSPRTVDGHAQALSTSLSSRKSRLMPRSVANPTPTDSLPSKRPRPPRVLPPEPDEEVKEVREVKEINYNGTSDEDKDDEKFFQPPVDFGHRTGLNSEPSVAAFEAATMAAARAAREFPETHVVVEKAHVDDPKHGNSLTVAKPNNLRVNDTAVVVCNKPTKIVTERVDLIGSDVGRKPVGNNRDAETQVLDGDEPHKRQRKQKWKSLRPEKSQYMTELALTVQEHPNILAFSFLGLHESDLRQLFESMLDSLASEDKLERLLELNNNRINNITDHIWRIFAKLNVSQLNLSCNSLKSVAERISLCRKLRILDVADNDIKLLPNTLSQLTELTMLNASRNHMACLPPGLGKLKRLQVLNLGCNEICELPNDMVEEGSELFALDISKNEFLMSVPLCLKHCSKLVYLETGGTGFDPGISAKDRKGGAASLLNVLAGHDIGMLLYRKRHGVFPPTSKPESKSKVEKANKNGAGQSKVVTNIVD